MGKDVPFKQLEVEHTFVLRGGYLKEPATLPVLRVPYLGDFIKLEKREQWLIRAVCGPGAVKRALARTTLLQTLREKVTLACAAGPSASPSAVADNANSALADGNAGGTDLMDAMAFDDELDDQQSLSTTAKPRPKKREKPVANDTLLRLTMPAQCPEKYPDNAATVTIKLYAKDRRTLYIDKDSVPWAVQYLYDQWKLGNVPVVIPTPQPTASDPPAAAGLAHDSIPPTTPTRTISWNFHDSAW